jgi:N-acetylglutamate synthase-like GNAT family acetyltransferase
MDILIRSARLSDSSSIRTLSRDCLGYDFPEEILRQKLSRALADSSQRVWVTEADGKVVGYLHAEGYDVLYAPHMKNILGIAVSVNCRRQGIGRRLLKALEDWGKEIGAKAIRLNSGETREGAHSFYRSCGYFSNKKQLNLKKYI